MTTVKVAAVQAGYALTDQEAYRARPAAGG
jgi:hypothetical protein